MLEARHIVKLHLDRTRLAQHEAMPMPPYVASPLIGQYSAISDTVLTSILGLDTQVFEAQLPTALTYGTKLLYETSAHRPIGISATTSLLKSGDVMAKNLIVPQDFLHFDRRLTDHILIAAFVRGHVSDGLLDCDDEIEIAGWATAKDIQMSQASVQPPTFQSKLKVVMVPCTSLRPMSSLLEQLAKPVPA